MFISSSNLCATAYLLKLCQTSAFLLRFIWGPVSLVALVFLALRDVSIAVGTWTCERLQGEACRAGEPQAVGDLYGVWVVFFWG